MFAARASGDGRAEESGGRHNRPTGDHTAARAPKCVMASASPEERAILERFQSMRSEVDQARGKRATGASLKGMRAALTRRAPAAQIWSKITELDLERQEHALVLETLTPLEGERRCFRLVGGVLVERTVGEVVPAVTRNREALEEVRASQGSAAPLRRSQGAGQLAP